jgi:hypothetical protein
MNRKMRSLNEALEAARKVETEKISQYGEKIKNLAEIYAERKI